ncbi:hypothetical protein LTR85_004166 [Meristemomyces frigidus]|nr:hypothetical protein LTR85_004166 [Meristemomyces frigidus]
MAFPGDKSSDPGQGARHPPLVIVSEQGRHSEESRRIVRAQAARASAAASRVTRARNRGEREESTREPLQSPPAHDASVREATQPPPAGASDQAASASMSLPRPGLETIHGQLPLANWLPSVLDGAAGAVLDRASQLSTASPLSMTGTSSPFRQPGTFGFQQSTSAASAQSPGEGGKFQLPMALPRGFAALQQRIPMADAMIGLITRTACVDFASPGVEQRLHQLLFDLIVKGAALGFVLQSGHPVQGHLRIACTCLTIFQGQRANGQIFSQDQKYQIGLEAAWSEAILLDRDALSEPKAAEVALWAVFIISVTTGATANFFHQALHRLMQDLQIDYWEQARRVLLNYIYPVSFLDEPCKHFYDNLVSVQVG